MADQLEKFPRIYNLTDFGITANVTCQPGIWSTVGEVIVPAGQFVTFGIGTLGATDSREVCYLRFDDASGNQIHGKVRFVLTDPNEKRSILVAEQRTQRLSADQNDRSKGFLLGEFPIRAKEDSKLQIKFYPDSGSAVTIDYDGTNTSGLIPVTVYQ
ncbi:MAG: hypothetical protein J7L15_08825 [Clostridiales bacterium]|nr:hypothetical protein [Clostridiales bacterium]